MTLTLTRPGSKPKFLKSTAMLNSKGMYTVNDKTLIIAFLQVIEYN